MQANTYRKFTFINVIFTFSIYLVSPLLAPYLVEKGFLDWQISLMFIAFPSANIIILPLFGKLADAVSRRLIIWLGIWIEIIALILYLINGHWGIIVIARFFDAIAASMVVLIILSKIEDSVSEKGRGKEAGLSLSWTYLGELLGPLCGAFIADYFFIKLPFIISAVILFILSFSLCAKEPKDLKTLPIKFSSLSWRSQINLFLSRRSLKGMGILGMVMHATNPAMNIFLPILIVVNLGMSYKSIGIVMFFYGITHIMQGIFGACGDKVGHWKMVLAGTSIYGIFFIMLSFASSYWLILILIFIIGIGGSMWNVGAWSLMSEVGEKEKIEAQVLTSYFSIAKIGSLISFIVSALLVKLWGIPLIFLINGLVIIFGNIAAYYYLKPVYARPS